MKNQSLFRIDSFLNQSLVALVLTLFSMNLLAATEVGYVDYARGVVTAQHGEEGMRIMGKNAKLYEKDIIKTGSRSFAIVRMKDGTKLTLRPDSSLGIEKYIARKGRSDSAILNLFKGGIRAITGYISKNRENAYKIRTPVATIGIRGTEFDARLCNDDCDKESKRFSNKQNIKTDFVIARIAFLRGQLSATDKHKKTRQVYTGGPLYEGDTLLTGVASFAVVAFKDKSRITLNSDTKFEIKKHHYDEKNSNNNSALMVLLRGGLRAVSGLIGKKNRNAYKMHTPVATIGIRGTGYDIQCDGKCIAESPQALITPLEKMINFIFKPVVAAMANDGMYAHVWDGSIELSNNAGSRLVNLNETAFLGNINSVPVMLPNVPLFMRSMPAPRPDKVSVSETVFSQNIKPDTSQGLYVSVYDGHVSMSTDQGERVDLGKGEAAYSGALGNNQSAPIRLSSIPAFQAADSYPRPESYNENWENLFNEVTNPDENQDFECTPQ